MLLILARGLISTTSGRSSIGLVPPVATRSVPSRAMQVYHEPCQHRHAPRHKHRAHYVPSQLRASHSADVCRYVNVNTPRAKTDGAPGLQNLEWVLAKHYAAHGTDSSRHKRNVTQILPAQYPMSVKTWLAGTRVGWLTAQEVIVVRGLHQNTHTRIAHSNQDVGHATLSGITCQRLRPFTPVAPTNLRAILASMVFSQKLDDSSESTSSRLKSWMVRSTNIDGALFPFDKRLRQLAPSRACVSYKASRSLQLGPKIFRCCLWAVIPRAQEDGGVYRRCRSCLTCLATISEHTARITLAFFTCRPTSPRNRMLTPCRCRISVRFASRSGSSSPCESWTQHAEPQYCASQIGVKEMRKLTRYWATPGMMFFFSRLKSSLAAQDDTSALETALHARRSIGFGT